MLRSKGISVVVLTLGLLLTAVDAGAEEKTDLPVQAAGKGNLEAVKKLLAEGAQVNERDTKGNTALIAAAAELLVEKGSDITMRNAHGMTALMIALAGGSRSFIPLRGKDTVTRILAEGRVDLMDTELCASMLWELRQDQLRLLRNTIYAKYGLQFKSKDLGEHFSRFPWYSPKHSNVDGQLTAEDKATIEYILWLEGKYGSYPPTTERLEGLLRGFWADSFPVPDAAAGYTFLEDRTYRFENPWKRTGSNGRWKIENKKVYFFTESTYRMQGAAKVVEKDVNPRWKELADFSLYRPEWYREEYQNGLPPTMLLLRQLHYKVK